MASIFSATTQPLAATRPISSCSIATPSVSNSLASNFLSVSLPRSFSKSKASIKTGMKVRAAATIETTPAEEIKEYRLPSWAAFEFGKAPVYWKTTNGLPPMAGEDLRVFYNPAANNISPNENFGIGFNGGFNQPIMCGGEPRAMLKKTRGSADPPLYSIHICVPKHALNLIFSFTNGTDWDGPYRLQFQVPKAWKNKPIEFFNEGLAEELGQEGACDRAIFPDTEIVVTSCAMVGNLTLEGGDRCDLDLVSGCTDPDSPTYNPLANVDDGSCPPYSSEASDTEE